MRGLLYGFGGANDFKPTINTGADRTINFAAGEAWGHHVRVMSDAQVSVQSATIGSGSRWDTFVLRRNWSGTGGTASVVISGSAATAIPSAALSNPGVLDDQLLCLAQITAGQTQPTGLIDLRTRGSKFILAPSLMSIKDPQLGMLADVGGTFYEYVLNATSNPVWVQQNLPTKQTGGSVIVTTTGWSAASPLVSRSLVKQGGVDIQYDVQIRRTTNSPLIQFDGNGNIADTTVATLQGPLPDFPVPAVFAAQGGLTSTPSTGFCVDMDLLTDGTLNLKSGLPNMIIGSIASGSYSLRGCVRFMREG
jgi:uncharacterized protein YodC (DUF2158 family)